MLAAADQLGLVNVEQLPVVGGPLDLLLKAHLALRLTGREGITAAAASAGAGVAGGVVNEPFPAFLLEQTVNTAGISKKVVVFGKKNGPTSASTRDPPGLARLHGVR